MTQKDVKKRDVLPFNEFVKARDTAMKAVMTKKGENPDPGAHAIKGEDLYVKHDANIYKASGIPHDEKMADINNLATAASVTVQGSEHDGQDPTGEDAKSKNVTDVATAKFANK
jgi:hypothetical protein